MIFQLPYSSAWGAVGALDPTVTLVFEKGREDSRGVRFPLLNFGVMYEVLHLIGAIDLEYIIERGLAS